MSRQLIVLVVFAGWVSVGPLMSVVMGRRGYSPAAWGILGTLLGPLGLPLAAARAAVPGGLDADECILTGRPADALARFAAEEATTSSSASRADGSWPRSCRREARRATSSMP